MFINMKIESYDDESSYNIICTVAKRAAQPWCMRQPYFVIGPTLVKPL